MTLYEQVIDREMWNSDIYEIRSGIYKVVVRLTKSGMFTGMAYRAGQVIVSKTSFELRDLVKNINESIRGLSNGTNTFRPEAVPGRDSRVAGTPEEARIGARSTAEIYARAKQKNMGHTPAKAAFDWGADIEREVSLRGESCTRSGYSGQESSFLEPGDAQGEGVGADVLSR
jgi:hypothetical protein